MAERPFSHPRWGPDSMQPAEVYAPPAYSPTPAGPVRRAELHDRDGVLLGSLWTDDRDAAGYQPNDDAGQAGLVAFAFVWALLKECRARDLPADQLLDQALFEGSGYELAVTGTTP